MPIYSTNTAADAETPNQKGEFITRLFFHQKDKIQISEINL